MHVLLSRSPISGHVRAKPTYLSAEGFSWIYFQSQREQELCGLNYAGLFPMSYPSLLCILLFCFLLMWLLTSYEVFHPFSSSSHLKPYLSSQHRKLNSF